MPFLPSGVCATTYFLEYCPMDLCNVYYVSLTLGEHALWRLPCLTLCYQVTLLTLVLTHVYRQYIKYTGLSSILVTSWYAMWAWVWSAVATCLYGHYRNLHENLCDRTMYLVARSVTACWLNNQSEEANGELIRYSERGQFIFDKAVHFAVHDWQLCEKVNLTLGNSLRCKNKRA